MGKKTELLAIAKQIRALPHRYASVDMATRLTVEALNLGAFSDLVWFQFRQRFEPSYYHKPVRPEVMLDHAFLYLAENRSDLPIPRALGLPKGGLRLPGATHSGTWAVTALPALAELIKQEANGEQEPASTTQLSVSLDPPQATFPDGTTHVITHEAAKLLNALVEADDWVPASKVVNQPSRVRDNMPQPVRILIEASTGKGFRIKPPE
jgi:hypothetical protein